MIDKIRSKVHVSDLHVLSVDEFLEMIADELASLGVGHSSLGVDRIHRRFPQAFAA